MNPSKPIRRERRWSDAQAAFAQALRQPDGPVPDLFAPCDAPTRMAVYRNNCAVARIEALKANYPIVARLVGDDFFVGMARQFSYARPPRHTALGAYGEDFPVFIADFAPARELPYLADVARLEWACALAFGAEDGAPMTIEALAGLDPEALLDARPIFHPAARAVVSAHPIVAIYHANQAERPAPIVDWRAQAALVVRPDENVLVHECVGAVRAFVAVALRGGDLRASATAALAADADFDFGRTLVEMIRLGALTRLETPTKKEAKSCKP